MHMISMVERGLEHRTMACEGKCQKKKVAQGRHLLDSIDYAIFGDTHWPMVCQQPDL
jgi:hypothetical protein